MISYHIIIGVSIGCFVQSTLQLSHTRAHHDQTTMFTLTKVICLAINSYIFIDKTAIKKKF